MSEYSGNGLFFQVKQGRKLSFHSLGDLLQMKKAQILRKYPLLPLISQTDYGKDQFEQHLFYVGLQQFRDSNNGMYPSPTSAQDANDVYSIFEKLSIDNGMECKESEKWTKLRQNTLPSRDMRVLSLIQCVHS